MFVPVTFVPPAVVAAPVIPLEPEGVVAESLVPPIGLEGVVPDTVTQPRLECVVD